MNPEYPTDPRQALEASLTALILGELPQDQAEFLRRTMAHDTELAQMYARLKQTIDLVREVEAAPTTESAADGGGFKLNQVRREKLLQQFKTVVPKEFIPKARRKTSPVLIAIAASVIILLLASTMLPSLARSKSKGMDRYFAITSASPGNAPNSEAETEKNIYQKRLVDELSDRASGLESLQSSRTEIVLPGQQTAANKPTDQLARNWSFGDVDNDGLALGQAQRRPTDFSGLGTEAKPPAIAPPKADTSASAADKLSAGVPLAGDSNEGAPLALPLTPPSESASLAYRIDNPGALPAPNGGSGGGGFGGRSVVPPAQSASSGAEAAQEKAVAAASADSAGRMRARFGLERRSGAATEPSKESEFQQNLTFAEKPVAVDPATGLPVSTVDPATGLPLGTAASDAEAARRQLLQRGEEAQRGQPVKQELTGGTTVLGDRITLGKAIEPRAGSNGISAEVPGFYSDSDMKALPSGGEDLPVVAGKAEAKIPQEMEGRIALQRSSTNSVTKLARDYAETKRGLEELQRSKQVLDLGLQSEAIDVIGTKSGTVDDKFKFKEQLAKGSLKDASLNERLAEQTKKVAEAKQKVDQLAQQPGNGQTDAAPAKPARPLPVPQPEIQTGENAFSTFSLNVSDVSFKLAAASLEKGTLPDAASIRSEEFINAFDYRDPEPPAGVAVGFAWDRARYPFAQNHDLLRFSVKTAAQGRQAGQPLNIVLLLDNSGSMERADRVQIIREALRVLAAQLQPQDRISLITFSRTATLRVDGAPGNQAGQVAEEASGLTPEGGTNLEEAMSLAYQTARKHYLAAGINRVVLLTDGAANLGDIEPENLKQKVENHRKQGIALDCFGIGWEGFNDDLLEVLARNGDGRYGFINTPEEASSEFAGQLAGALHVTASDVKVQVEFNPKRVTAWRQIGYAKHQLTKEQFRDNTVDAAEIGAAESGNALYAVEVNPRGEGALATVRVRFKIPGTADYREHEWAVPYNGNAVSLEQASTAIRLAAAASAFSEWLSTSPYASEVTPDALLGYLRGVPEIYGADTRPQKLEWMIRQAKSLTGK